MVIITGCVRSVRFVCVFINFFLCEIKLALCLCGFGHMCCVYGRRIPFLFYNIFLTHTLRAKKLKFAEEVNEQKAKYYI